VKGKIIYGLVLLLLAIFSNAQTQSRIVVDIEGKGDFKTIQGAINSMPDSSVSPRVIFIKKGVYNEKLYIEKENIVLEGEDREKTKITESIARDAWRCGHTDDWGVATMNVGANDITLKISRSRIVLVLTGNRRRLSIVLRIV